MNKQKQDNRKMMRYMMMKEMEKDSSKVWTIKEMDEHLNRVISMNGRTKSILGTIRLLVLEKKIVRVGRFKYQLV